MKESIVYMSSVASGMQQRFEQSAVCREFDPLLAYTQSGNIVPVRNLKHQCSARSKDANSERACRKYLEKTLPITYLNASHADNWYTQASIDTYCNYQCSVNASHTEYLKTKILR